jgi:hypothetical protein
MRRGRGKGMRRMMRRKGMTNREKSNRRKDYLY